MQVMADLVYGELLWLREHAGGVEGIFFEEESDLVAGCEEVVVAYVRGLLARGELGHGMVIEGEVREEVVGFGEKGGGCGW